MGKPLPPPPANILTPCLRSLLHLVSVIPTQHPNESYHTWCSHSDRDQSGLYHILAALEYIYSACSSGIDCEISRSYLKSDHYLIYATYAISCSYTTPIPLATRIYHYRRVSSITLIKTYPTGTNDNFFPWFANKTLGILPNDVRSHAMMHGTLVLVHGHP